jgi:3-keto-5-aminohexanoate cleavage enzyme
MSGKRRVVISVAPVGGKPSDGGGPFTPGEVAEDTIACAEAGAGIVHLHVRDEKGETSSSLDAFNETIRRIRGECDIVIQGSTGGAGEMSAAERCVALDAEEVEMASLNMGSTNFFDTVYVNSPDDIRYWSSAMKERGITPELEIFSLDMIHAAEPLLEQSLLSPPLRYSACLGIPGAMPADPRYLCFFSSMMRDNDYWGLMHHGMKDFSLLLHAAGLGASWLRVGFEDSRIYAGEKTARDNRELVAELREVLERAGYEVVPPREVRSALALPGA